MKQATIFACALLVLFQLYIGVYAAPTADTGSSSSNSTTNVLPSVLVGTGDMIDYANTLQGTVVNKTEADTASIVKNEAGSAYVLADVVPTV